MRMNAASDSGDELMRESASLLMSNYVDVEAHETFDEWETGAEERWRRKFFFTTQRRES